MPNFLNVTGDALDSSQFDAAMSWFHTFELVECLVQPETSQYENGTMYTGMELTPPYK